MYRHQSVAFRDTLMSSKLLIVPSVAEPLTSPLNQRYWDAILLPTVATYSPTSKEKAPRFL